MKPIKTFATALLLSVLIYIIVTLINIFSDSIWDLEMSLLSMITIIVMTLIFTSLSIIAFIVGFMSLVKSLHIMQFPSALDKEVMKSIAKTNNLLEDIVIDNIEIKRLTKGTLDVNNKLINILESEFKQQDKVLVPIKDNSNTTSKKK